MSMLPADALAPQFQRHIHEPLAELRHWIRLYLALNGLLRLLLVLVAAGGIQLVVDWSFKLSVDQRFVLSAVITLYWLRVIYRRLLVPLTRPLPDRVLAGLVERRHPELQDRLATAVELAGGVLPGRGAAACDAARLPAGTSPALVRALLVEACRAAEGISFQRILNHGQARWCTLEVCGLLVLIGLALRYMPGPLGTWFVRNWLWQDVAWPQHTYILPEGFDGAGHRRMARGDLVEIRAHVIGDVPDNAVLHWKTPSGRRGRENMSLVGDTQFVAAAGQLSEDVHFHIVGGDEHTRSYVVEAVERPRVVHLLARVTPPEYTRLAPVVIEQQTVLEILQGATLELEALVNKPIQEARFVAADGTAARCNVSWEGPTAEPALVRVYWTAPDSGVYHFELRDTDGLPNHNPVGYTLRVVPDRPPHVQMELVDVGELVTPQAELPVELLCEDAYGLGAVRLLVQAGGRAERPLPPPGFSAGRRKFASEFGLAVAASSVVAGEALRVWAEAEDLDPHGPNVGATPVATLQVVSPDQFLMEMARRELALRQEFERLLSAQRQLKDSLERILAGLPDGAAPAAEQVRRLADLARRQAEFVGRCLELARAFDRILRELQMNRLARPADERRIGDRVVAPLGRMVREAVSAAVDTLDKLCRVVDAESRSAALAAQDEVLQQMRAVLANMLEWEGYREAVALLEAVIAAQAEVRAGTRAALAQQLEDILGPDEPPEGPGSGLPNP